MSYNFLRNARSVSNSLLCRYDTLDGYTTDFSLNGDFDGWDIYENIYLYGSWNGVLFGTASDRSCYIGRTLTMAPTVPAENFYIVKIMMKITDNVKKAVGGLTTGRLQWITLNDPVWDSDKQEDFDIYKDNKWHLYEINMGPIKDWQGDISNLRVYPFIDGWATDQFAIKYIKISSLDEWACTNTNCSYYPNYEHPCPGAGRRASSEAGVSKDYYTTYSGVNDKLIVNIDGYGDEEFELGTNINLNGVEMARVVTNTLGILNVGSYAFAQAEYSEFDKIKITSGNTGSDSSVSVKYSVAAKELGFYDGTTDVSTNEGGLDQATGFDYAASRIFRPFEINKMIDGYRDVQAYVHNPDQFSVEGGRRDFAEVGNSRLISDLKGTEYYESLNNKQRTIIDASHPINNNGRIKAIYIFGKIEDDTTAKIKICRPKKDGTMRVVHSLTFDSKQANTLYTKRPLSYRIDCDILVSKGDLIGIYNADLYVGISITGYPDATFYQYDGEPSGTFDPGRVYALGAAGLALYGRGDRRQNNAILEVDMGTRINIEEVTIYGEEKSGYFDFNVASCLDVDWNVNLFGQSHTHTGINWSNGTPWSVTHLNIAYGEETLADMQTTPDGGQCGDSYYSDNGLATAGTHTYFYVNGDAEWLYTYSRSDISEFSWPFVPYGTYGFRYDPIEFTLLFPNENEISIHRSIMYFKEEDNFRRFSLSYYLGSDNATGNSDDPNYQYIPSYNSIRLDGILYDETNNEVIDAYLFQNPASDESIYVDGQIQNVETVKEAHATWWNTIEHNFDPIKCKGFRIYCDKHESTKIMELEVYSRLSTDPALVDNMSMSFSDYGEVWKSASFEEIEEGKVVAFVGGAPQYFRLEFDSSTEFTLNEIDFAVGDQVKLPSCDETVLLENAKTNELSAATELVLENIYDRPFDLIVDLPVETSETDDLIFWSKLDSEEDIENPDLGPACFLQKEDNYNIFNDNRQCAINVPCYALKNLVHNKEAYKQDHIRRNWDYFGTLSSGTSVDYCNTDEMDLKETVVTFSGVYSKYWRIYGIQYGSIRDINNDFAVLKEDSVVDITNITTNVADGFLFTDLVTGNHIIPTWSGSDAPGGSHTTTNVSVEVNNFGTDVVWHGTTVTDYFSALTDFELNFGFILYRISNNRMGQVKIRLYDATNELILQWEATDAWTASQNVRDWLYDKAARIVDGYIHDYMYNTYDDINNVSFVREGGNLIYKINGVTRYNSSFSTDPITRIEIDLFRNPTYTQPDRLLVHYGKDINFRTLSMTTLDEAKFRMITHFPEDVDIYIGPDGITYFKGDDMTVQSLEQNFYTYFAIDLEARHNIDIIRNYGDDTNKLLLDKSSNIEYSNTETVNIDNVIWNNSDYEDARWMRVKFLCGDDVERCVRKLGIYPNIEQNGTPSGEYNCEWESLGTKLADYAVPVNVAFGATTTGTNYYFSLCYPDNAVDGVHTEYGANDCWAFEKEYGGDDPYIELDLGQTYLINQVELYHGYNPDVDDYLATDYTFSVSTTTTGSFTDIFSISSNSDHYRLHQFTPVNARRVRLTITAYDSGERLGIYNPSTNTYEVFKGGFLREMEVYTYVSEGYIDSETWPIVCMNLRQSFDIANHALLNKDLNDEDTDWDNDDQFFYYSTDGFDDPQKVTFRDHTYTPSYESLDSSGNIPGDLEYIFDREVYFEAGTYIVEWQAYDADSDDEISLQLAGIETIDHFAYELGNGIWVTQTGFIQINVAGYYDVKGVWHKDIPVNYSSGALDWGIRYPKIEKYDNLSKWIAVKRDTAENYSYDDDSAKYGEDYLEKLKVFVNNDLRPTEYYWWWDSVLSTLSNDYMYTKVGARSLKMRYPTSSGVDTVQFIEGDDFGIDENWSTKDTLQFWLYISNVSRLDTSFGDISFGDINSANAFYYTWNISGLNLQTGWNLVKLKFDEYDSTYPEVDRFGTRTYLEEILDLRTNEKDMKSFRIRFRGVGQSFNMYLDDIHIERNTFEDMVYHGKGLHLTGNEVLKIPVSGLTLEKGAVEFWLKTYYDSYGQDVFDRVASRTFFTITNNNNDIVSFGLRAGNWFEVITGNIRRDLNKFNAEYANLLESNYVEIGEVIHLAIAWSHDSEFMDNDHTVRLYLNGERIYAATNQWSVSDSKDVTIMIGGKSTQLSFNQESYGAGIFDNLKIYTYPKDDFRPYLEGIEKDITYTPNQFLQISGDGVNFYGVDSDQLPLIFEQVPAGDSRTIYLRSNKNDNFSQSEKTANLVVQWLTTV